MPTSAKSGSGYSLGGGGGGGGILGVNIEDDGVQVVPLATTLDFVGPGVTVTNSGGGQATITIPGGGPPGAYTLQAAYTGGNSIVTAGGLPVAFNLTAGGFTVEGPGSIEVGVVTPISIFDVNAASTITLDSTGGAIGIGTDAVSQPINVGTGAAARKITVGNSTGATEVEVNTGTVGFDLNASGPIALDGVGASNLTASAGNLTLSTTTSGTLGLSSAGDLTFSDQYKSASTYAGAFKFSAASAEYSTFETNFGEVSLLNAINQSKAAGRILQVVHAQYDTQVLVSGATAYTDTGLTATITPTSVNSKVLVLVSQQCYNIGGTTTNTADQSAYAGLRLLRGATAIWEPWQPTNLPVSHGIRVTMATAIINDIYMACHLPIVYLDSPATTSATTYKTQGKGHTTGQDSYFNVTGSTSNGKSNIVLMEIAG